MKVLTLTWEYPPKVVGGIARVVFDLSKELANSEVECSIITCGSHDIPLHEVDGNIEVNRVIPYAIENYEFIQWVYHLNLAMIEKAVNLHNQGIHFDIIHAHDWITAYSAKVLKGIFNIPLVSTIHATEFGRNNGLHNNLQKYISNTEWWLTYESHKVIVNSRFMESQLAGFFQLPEDKITIIPNGVSVQAFESEKPNLQFRRQYASDNEKIIFSVGRLVEEKGIQLLLDAIPIVSKSHNDFKVIISGKGPNSEKLKSAASAKGIDNRVYFTGFIDDETRNKLYKLATVAVFPSLYEPFGIVALEGMAAGVPVIASDTGGLRETIDNEVDGLKFSVGSADDLAKKLLYILENPLQAEKIAKNGHAKVNEIYNWRRISKMVKDLYHQVLEEKVNYNTEMPIGFHTMDNITQ